MSIGDYNTLLTNVSSWSARADAPIADCIRLAEMWLTRRLRLRTGEDAVSLPTVAGQDYVALPAGTLVPRYYRLTLDPESDVRIVGMSEFTQQRSNTGAGRPIVGMHSQLRLYLAPTPTAIIQATLFREVTPLALTVDLPTNFLLETSYDLYLKAALCEVGTWAGDDARLEGWVAQREQLSSQVSGQEQRGRFGGGKLRVRPTVFPA